MRTGPLVVLESFKVSASSFGIASFTDILPKLRYEDTCSGNYATRTLRVNTKILTSQIYDRFLSATRTTLLWTNITAADQVKLSMKVCFHMLRRLTSTRTQLTEQRNLWRFFQHWPQGAHTFGSLPRIVTWRGQSAWYFTQYLSQLKSQSKWNAMW